MVVKQCYYLLKKQEEPAVPFKYTVWFMIYTSNGPVQVIHELYTDINTFTIPCITLNSLIVNLGEFSATLHPERTVDVVKACIALYNMLPTLMRQPLRQPPTFVDGTAVTGDFLPGEWRSLVARDDNYEGSAGCSCSLRQSEDILPDAAHIRKHCECKYFSFRPRLQQVPTVLLHQCTSLDSDILLCLSFFELVHDR